MLKQIMDKGIYEKSDIYSLGRKAHLKNKHLDKSRINEICK